MAAKNKPTNILLVEDEKNLAFTLELNLKSEGFNVDIARNGREALELFASETTYRAILLDIMLPELDGFSVAEQIRSKDAKVGILMLTARASKSDRLKGLELGVDDYITKPFHLKELLSRVKRMVERAILFESITEDPYQKTSPNIKTFGPITLDYGTLKLHGVNGTHDLTTLEADVIAEFMSKPEQILSRTHLLNKVWGLPGNLETRTVDNFIARIRKLIENKPNSPKYLVSIRGRGYKLTSPEQSKG